MYVLNVVRRSRTLGKMPNIAREIVLVKHRKGERIRHVHIQIATKSFTLNHPKKIASIVPIAAKIRAKDDDQCQSCDTEWEKGQNRFPVHHILPKSLGGPDEEWNLITLCPSCHPKTDKRGGPVRYPTESQTKLPDFDLSEDNSPI